MEYASNGKGNLGVTLGAIGTGLGALGNIGVLGGMGRGCGYGYGFNDAVSHYDLNMSQMMAQKDAEIAMLKAESRAEEKMIEVYKQTRSEIKALENELEHYKHEQIANNANIAVINDVLRRITAVRVPNSAVCPGWGDVTITPTPVTTPAA